MKQGIKKLALLCTALLLLVVGTVSAQNNAGIKTDRVIFLNGDTKEGKVMAFANDKVQFIHKGETLNYEFDRKAIEKIEYASGRTEIVNRRKEVLNAWNLAIAKNKVAVLPLGYMADENNAKMENMPFRLQEMTIDFLSQSSAELKFMAPVEINALLLRAGINDSNIREYTPMELAAVLQAEYIVMGSVMQDKGGVTTSGSSYNENRKTVDRRYDDTRVRERNASFFSTSTNQQIENHVFLSIYNSDGDKIYSKSRQSLLATMDGYKYAMKYLLKRTPLYNR